ncbi:putative C-terminal processing peptidase [Rhodospirillaceae bacterium LM-1]|nr:putative C-terminal processing peptidase [Rhodospirillaceae bacterium LM-1]
MRAAIHALLVALALSACVVSEETAVPPGEAPKPVAATPFPALEAEAVLSKGFQAIREFSLEEIDVASFALEGAKGLGSIDPNLVAASATGKFQLLLGDEKVFSASLPPSGDPRGWARLIIEGLMAARSRSTSLSEAGPEDVYQAVFDAALARFDLHSRYAGSEETKRLKARRDGQTEDGARLPPTVGMSLGDQIAHIQIVGFNQQTAASLEAKLREAMNLYDRQLKGVILDLRGNPGGLLEQAVRSADLFLGAGRIVAARGRHPVSSVNHEAIEGELVSGVPMVVLVDGRTASGGEVLAAALQDRGRAVIVGSTTFGKGLVQTVIELPNGAEIDLSWSRLHAPSGYALQGLGVLPNVCTSLTGKDKSMSGASEVLAAEFAQWRTVGIGNSQARARLRTLCPPESQDGRAEAVALGLLSDRSLYAKALAPTGAYLGVKP